MARRFLALLRRRPAYRSLWLAELVSMTGDWFSIVAVSVVALRGPGGGALTLALALAAHLLPSAFMAPLGGLVADRVDRRKVLLYGNLLEGVLTVGMLLAALGRQVAVLTALVAVRSMCSAAREPASAAALPRLVATDELEDANALGGFTWSLAFTLGMGLGGLVTELGPAVAFSLDALSFFGAVALLARLPPIAVDRDDAPGARGLRLLARDLKEGLRAAWSPSRRGSVFGHTPVGLVHGAGWLAMNLAAEHHPLATGGAATLGFLQAIRGFGTAVGPLGLGASSMPRAVSAHLAVLAFVLGGVGMALAGSFLTAALAAFAWGCGAGVLWTVLSMEIQAGTEDALRGRMMATSGLGFTVSMTVGALLAALSVEGLGSPTAGVALLAAVTAAGWLSLRGPLPAVA
ncbi:MAG: MFS transporter [Deltaproteobacteria bacterium]|nr:MFS transporter [Deltaproteobacteria bacterium]